MNTNEFFETFGESLKHFSRNLSMIIPGLILWGILVGFSKISEKMNYRFTTSISLTLWIVFFSLVTLAVMSLFFSGLIGMSIKKKSGLIDFLNYGNKFWTRNFFVMVIIVVIGILIDRAAFYGAFFIGKFLNFGTYPAQGLFLLIYLIGVAGFLIFFTFSSFFLVTCDLKVRESLRKSFAFVKKNYPYVVVLSLILFIVYYFANLIPSPYGEAFEYGILVPYLAILMTKFVMKK